MYLVVFLGSYALTLAISSTLMNTRIASIKKEIEKGIWPGGTQRHIEAQIADIHRSKLEYGVVAGTLLGLIISAVLWFMTIV